MPDGYHYHRATLNYLLYMGLFFKELRQPPIPLRVGRLIQARPMAPVNMLVTSAFGRSHNSVWPFTM